MVYKSPLKLFLLFKHLFSLDPCPWRVRLIWRVLGDCE